MFISVGTSIDNLVHSQTETGNQSAPKYSQSGYDTYKKQRKLTLSSTAPGSIPNLSAMATIRSGRKVPSVSM